MAPVLQIGETNVEQGEQLDQSDQTEQGGEEEPHPADGLAVDNVQHVLGDVELQLADAPDPPDVQADDDKDLGEQVQHGQPIELHTNCRLPADFAGTRADVEKIGVVTSLLMVICLIICTPTNKFKM